MSAFTEPVSAPGVPRPEVTPPEDWAFPVPVRHLLDNGLVVLVFDIPGQYVISVRSVIPLNLASEPRDREGIATVMARLLDEGTSAHSGEEFAELMERKGIALGAGVTEGSLGVDLDVPARNLGPALDLMRQALAEPAFPEAETARHVATRLAEIEQERASAPHRAAREFIATFYDPHERASRPTAGTAATVAAITSQDLREFHARHVGPSGATVAIAGDLSGVDLLAVMAETLGRWQAPGHQAAAEPVAARRAEDAARIVLVDRPGSVQSELSVGCLGPHRRIATGWAPYPVLGFMVGGSPTARVDAVLREEKGYTYGIRSVFRPRPRDGIFLTSGSVRADATVESLQLLVDLLGGARDGFTTDEVRSGVDFLAQTAPGRYATADAVADEATNLAVEGLPEDFTTQNLRRIKALDVATLDEAYRTWVDGVSWTVVVVGDADTLAGPIRALGLGEVTVVPA